MKSFGLSETKLFHFHGIFKKNEIKSAKPTTTVTFIHMNPLSRNPGSPLTAQHNNIIIIPSISLIISLFLVISFGRSPSSFLIETSAPSSINSITTSCKTEYIGIRLYTLMSCYFSFFLTRLCLGNQLLNFTH